MNLTLKIVYKLFCTTHCLMIIHHHNKFGKKWFSSAGDTEWTQLDRTTDGQGDSNILPPVFISGGGGDIMNK